MWISISLLLLLTATVHSCPDSYEIISKIKAEPINYRLPQHVRPIRYHITLEPKLDLDPPPFFGAVTIELEVQEETKNITLHTRQLNITENSINLVDNNGKEVVFANTSIDQTREFYIIKFKTVLERGAKYNLTIGHYSGILKPDKSGFYLAKYYDKAGQERRFATTQFQSTGARKAFPCFDEPHMKASFIVHLIRSENMSSISNQELLCTVNIGDGRVMDTYKETVPMSTYLAAFVVSDYTSTDTRDRQRVFADTESVAAGEAEFALQIGIDTLNSLEKFLDVNYSMNKIDQIAIPDDFFSPGAMENWGLVTYRKSYLVYPIDRATTSELQRTVTIIAHEYAHQWFGNLVTASWWRYIWLNEGFANYFESFAASLVQPAWRFMDQFILTSLQRAFENDSLNSTKPMNSETDYPGGGPPSYVSYQKSGAVIRMFEHFLSKDVFRSALNMYLINKAFEPVEPLDLYRALQKAAEKQGTEHFLGNLTVPNIMHTWDSQAGYPVVDVDRDYDTGHILLHQERFFLKENSAKNSQIWYIPINYVFYSDNSSNFNETTPDFWMTERAHILYNFFPITSWLIVNKQQTGYYRVNYDITNWNRIIIHLNSNNIHDIHLLNRAQLIDDAFNLARAGQLHYHIPLNLSKYLRNEVDYIPLTSFLNAVGYLKTMLSGEKEYTIFEEYINDLLYAAFSHLGFEPKLNDKHLDKLNRINVLNWMCNTGNSECRNYALGKLQEWKINSSISVIASDLETPIFCGAIRIGNQDDSDFLYHKYEVAGNISQKTRILNALGCSENRTILNRFLDKVLDNNSTLRVSDRLTVFRAVFNAGNTGLQTAFQYVDEHFEKLRYKVNIPSLLQEIAAKFTTEAQLNELIALIKRHGEEEKTYETAIKNVKENIHWNTKYIGNILIWLNDYKSTK